MPLKILPLPVEFPNLLGLDVSRLGNRTLMRFAIASPHRTDFEYLHALTFQPKAQIQLLANVRRWSTLRYESTDHLLHPLDFKLAEHDVS